MGVTKSSSFTDEQNELAELAKALAHPARIAILSYLLGKEACQCSTIVEELPLSQATVSQHLKALKEVGLIQGEIQPPRVCYCINEEKWQHVAQLFSQLFGRLPIKGCC